MDTKQKNGIFFALYLFFWLGENCLSPYLGVYYEAQGLSGIQIGIVNSTFSIAVILAALAAGIIGDCLGKPRNLLLVLCFGMILGTALLSAACSYHAILIAVILYGIAYSPFNGIADKVLMCRLKDRPGDFGKYRTGGTIGAGIGVVLAGILIVRTRFFSLFLVYWAAAVLCAVCCLRLPVEQGADGVMEKAQWKDYGIILRHRSFLSIYLTMAVWGFTEAGVTQFQALHVISSGYASHYTSIFVAVAMVGESLMFIAVPKISVLLGRRRTIAMAFLLQFFRAGALAGLAWLPLPLVVFCQFIGGGAYAALYSVITQAISETFPARVSCSAQTLKLVVTRGIGMTLGSMLLGFLYQHSLSVLSYGILACVAGASSIYAAASTIRRPPKSGT